MQDSSDEEEVSLGCSTLTLSPLVPESPPVRRSHPIVISTNRKKGGEVLSSSEPPIPNPFPELCNLSLLHGSLPSESSDKFVIKVYRDESAYKSILIGRQATAREVCQLLVQSAHCQRSGPGVGPVNSLQDNLALLEIYPTLGLERCLEDHEIVAEVQATWSQKVEARFMFSKNYNKYEFFDIQWRFFAKEMISDSSDLTRNMRSTVFIRELIFSENSPQIRAFFYLKGYFKKSWKKMFFTLRRSGLYISTKETDNQHLKEFDKLNVSTVYKVVDGCKRYGAPTDFCFCIKPTKSQGQVKDLKIMCAETEEIRDMWICAFRLFKCGRQIKQNYDAMLESKLGPRTSIEPLLSESKSKSENGLVAMDFTGKAGGRVIENPTEAQNAEQEEAQAWRKREALRFCQPNTNSESLDFSFHETHPWFYGGLTRNEAEKLIEKQGLVDGMFLIRRSQQHENCFVLTLCHELKVKHFIVIPVLEDGKKYLTLDDGKTRFIDLLQLVEFYQINKGALPACLTRPCICVPL